MSIRPPPFSLNNRLLLLRRGLVLALVSQAILAILPATPET